MDRDELASHIDHTVLRPDARRADVERACKSQLSSVVQESASTRFTSLSQVGC